MQNLNILVFLLAIYKFKCVFGAVNCNPTFPTAINTVVVEGTWNISTDKDFGMIRLVAGHKVGGSIINENDSPILFLEPGVTVSNVIIGNPASKGIWCKGSCKIVNVWWESVGTHAGNFGTDPLYWDNPSNQYIIQGGGAKHAVEKVFIQQGAGTTTINNFYAHNVSKLLRSCGNCNKQFFNRRLVLNNVVLEGPTLTVIGLNANYQDTLSVKNLELCNSNQISFLCQAYNGTIDFNALIGTGPKPTPLESVRVGQPLDKKTCNDPNAKIDIIS